MNGNKGKIERVKSIMYWFDSTELPTHDLLISKDLKIIKEIEEHTIH